MQCIYAYQSGAFISIALADKSLHKNIQSSYSLLLFNLLTIRQVAEHARKEAKWRREKKLPSKEDLNFSTRLAENSLVVEMATNTVFADLIKASKVQLMENEDLIKQLFRNLLEHKEYQRYIAKATPTWEDDRDILLHIYGKVMLASETFTQELEELFPNWIDDQASVNFKVNQLLGEKEFAAELNKRSQFIPDEEDEEFASVLLHKTHSNDAEFDKLIEPKLQNWDLERIASLDMILMKMALCELMYFGNIPVKVSINEYIDISKVYSTPKSKDFINGVLDKLMNQLKEEGRIKKQGRGLMG